MSHRVTTQTEIKDPAIAKKALKQNNWSFVEEGNSLRITSGPMARATINLTTGEVVGDTDVHNATDKSLGALKQGYAEMKYRQGIEREGGDVFQRSVDQKTGDIILHCRVNFG